MGIVSENNTKEIASLVCFIKLCTTKPPINTKGEGEWLEDLEGSAPDQKEKVW